MQERDVQGRKCTKPKEEEETGGTGPKLRHWWVGAGVSIDLQFLSGARDVCLLNNSGTAPAGNNGAYYCVDSTGTSYPPATMKGGAENSSLLIAESDSVNGGIAFSNLRIFASLDYALNYNLLLGVRFGYSAMDYPGQAFKLFAPLLIEGRATYVFGKEAIMTKGFAPVILLGVGVAPFSSGVGVTAYECDTGGNAGDPAGTVVNNGKPGSGRPGKGEICPAGANEGKGPGGSTPHNVTAWRVDGPLFVAPGGGIRYAFSDRAALSINLKLALVFGNGFLFDPTPEATFQYGF